VNDQITVDKIRLVGSEGQMLGVVTVSEGIRLAREEGLDLVEISPTADPPVCKILDIGKYKYELQKKKAVARKNQKVVEVKEIKLRPVTGENDYQVKLKSARRFLEEGDKVKVTLRFRGREIAHTELGTKMIERMRDDLQELGKVEANPKMEGKQLMMILAPKA
jgi:translation initiation factor IF-3